MSNKKTAIVASAAALGAIVLGVGGFFGSRYALRKRAEARHSQQTGMEDDDGNDAPTFDGTSDSVQPGYKPLMVPPLQNNMQNSDLQPDPNQFSQRRQMPSEIASMSDYPVTERHMTDDFYNHTPATTLPPTMPLPEPPAGYSSSPPPLPSSAAFRTTQGTRMPESVPESYLDTFRSGSGSSVQSDMLDTRRRQSSMDLNIRNSWWKHASQWNDPGVVDSGIPDDVTVTEVQPNTGRVVTFERPYSGSSTYSTLRDFRNRSSRGKSRGPSKISAPYLQDNSLML